MGCVLYHYCSADTFWKIIKGRCIRLSSVLDSNDSSEGLLLKNLLSSLIQNDSLNCTKEQIISKWMTRICEIRGGRAFCLTTERDLLSQWCRYADDGQGISIGFSREYLGSLPETKLECVEYNHDKHVESARCLYEKLKEPAPPIDHNGQLFHAAGLGQWNPQHKESKDATGRRNADDFIQESLRSHIQQALWDAGLFLIKHNGFREEREVRLLDATDPPVHDSFQNIEMEADRSPILEVMLGPRNLEREDRVREKLAMYGFGDVQVSKSDIPYRGRMNIGRITAQEFFQRLQRCPDCDSPGIAEFLDYAVGLLSPHSDILPAGKALYRVQRGFDDVDDCLLQEDNPISGIQAFSPERMIPKIPECGAGRFHVAGESAFYFSAEIETAVKEMKPCRGMEFSVAEFETKVALKMAVIPENHYRKMAMIQQAMSGSLSADENDKLTLSELYRHCSWPVFENGEIFYRPTQKLAQRLREKGYDGIIYASSMEPRELSGALFCPPDENPQCYFPKLVEFKRCFMKKVAGLQVSFDEDYENDPTVLGR